MSGIKNFLGKGESRVKKARKILKGKSKKERRKIEQHLLKPERIPEYTGELPKKGPIERRTIEIICKTETDVDIIRRHFKVSEYKRLNIRNITLLMKFLDALDEGSLQYEKEEENLYFVGEQGEKIQL